MARDVLAIPIFSVVSECSFSTGGRVIDPFRSSLTPKLVKSLICLQDWLRREPIPINIEKDLEYLEQLEVEMAYSEIKSSIVDVSLLISKCELRSGCGRWLFWWTVVAVLWTDGGGFF
ncbi:putative protein isoform X2 [Capsicum annuum]|uniref:uncharacterized protein LOC107878929 isoform X2 n=1 Tax=Capsicum annuum TaxID=4072 RepID=UPI001FB04C4A|nr:uncharacterized protein LOC107878929 isoform X2 [Capsicum annuum]